MYAPPRFIITSVLLQEICRFFRTEQADNDVTIDKAKELIEKYEPDEECRRAHEMSIYGFTYMLVSPHGDIFNIKHRKVYFILTFILISLLTLSHFLTRKFSSFLLPKKF